MIIEELIDQFGIDRWDLILVGDGSGSKWQLPIGWACLAYTMDRVTPRLFYGAANDGTVNLAETQACVIPLLWYLRVTRGSGDKAPKRIHIITDSQYVRDAGQGGVRALQQANQILWTAIDMVSRQGMSLTFHWAERDTSQSNQCADLISKQARALFKNEPAAEWLQQFYRDESRDDRGED